MSMTRRAFVGITAGTTAGLGIVPRYAFAQPASGGAPPAGAQPTVAGGGSSADKADTSAPWSPVTNYELAREVVGASHARFDRLRELVDARPALAASAVDWGFGDWETAIGAASHVGRADIAEYLIAHGARPDLFTFAMLGNLGAVKAMIEATPGLQRLNGPHSLTLMHHARAGGEAGAAVVAYLETLEGADEKAVSQPVEEAAAITGVYRITSGGDGGGGGGFEIAEGKRGLEFRLEGTRNLVHLGGLEFHPAGAKRVRFRFVRGGEGAPPRVRIEDGPVVVEALRQA